jgi:hypothetical protein
MCSLPTFKLQVYLDEWVTIAEVDAADSPDYSSAFGVAADNATVPMRIVEEYDDV